MDGQVLQSSKHIQVHFNLVASGRAIVSGRQVHTCVVLDQLPSPMILGMPFLADTNPTIDWYAKSVIFGEQMVLGTLSLCEIQVELCFLRSLMKNVCKSQSAAWFTLLQPSGSLLAMGASDVLDGEQEGPRTPLATHRFVWMSSQTCLRNPSFCLRTMSHMMSPYQTQMPNLNLNSTTYLPQNKLSYVNSQIHTQSTAGSI